jgi:peptidoglycan/LPS O-acetylase OafA/YrhL
VIDHATYLATRRFGSLDGLRALAVAAVVWHHSPAGRGFGDWAATWRGYLGVDLFFVLSGFLITTLLLRERDTTGRIAVGAFLGRRALRLFPLYYAVLAGAALVFTLWPESPGAAPFFRDVPWHATYTSNWVLTSPPFVITWSLSAEEQFYLAWVVLLVFLAEGAWAVAAAVALVSVAVTAGALDGLLTTLLGPSFRDLDMVQATFLPLALGCLVGFALHSRRSFVWLAKPAGRAVAAPLAVLFVIAVTSAPVAEPFRYGRPFAQLALAGLLVTCVVREEHALAPFLRARALVRLGLVSYGVYLLHMPTLRVVRPRVEALGLGAAATSVAVFAANLAAAWLAAELSHRLLERPFLRWKDRLRPERGRPDPLDRAGLTPGA